MCSPFPASKQNSDITRINIDELSKTQTFIGKMITSDNYPFAGYSPLFISFFDIDTEKLIYSGIWIRNDDGNIIESIKIMGTMPTISVFNQYGTVVFYRFYKIAIR